MAITYINDQKLLHAYDELNRVYDLRVNRDDFEFSWGLKFSERDSSYYNSIVKNDVKKYGSYLANFSNQIHRAIELLEDIEFGFKPANKYIAFASQVAYDLNRGISKKKIINYCRCAGFHSKQISLLFKMAKNPNATKIASGKSTLVAWVLEKERKENKATIANKDKEIENQKSQNTAKDEEIAEKNRQIAEKDQEIAEKDQQINELNNRSSEESGEEQESSGTTESYSSGNNNGGESSGTQETPTDTEPSGGENPEEPVKSDPVNPTPLDPEEPVDPVEDPVEDDPIKISDPEDTTSTPSKKSNVIPAVLGVGAAGAAGFAGVRYIKNKNKDNYNADNYDEEEEGSDDVDYSYSDDNNGEENYSTEKYSAGNKEKDETPVNDSNNLSLDEDEEIKIEDDYQDDFNEELE